MPGHHRPAQPRVYEQSVLSVSVYFTKRNFFVIPIPIHILSDFCSIKEKNIPFCLNIDPTAREILPIKKERTMT